MTEHMCQRSTMAASSGVDSWEAAVPELGCSGGAGWAVDALKLVCSPCSGSMP